MYTHTHILIYIYILFFLPQLVDLKAELYRKQEVFKQEKLTQDSGSTSRSHNHTKVNKQRFSTQELKCAVFMICVAFYLLFTCRNPAYGVNRTKAWPHVLRRMSRKRQRRSKTWTNRGDLKRRDEAS